MKDSLLHDCPLCPAIIRAKVNSYRIFPTSATAHSLTHIDQAILCAIPHILSRIFRVLEDILTVRCAIQFDVAPRPLAGTNYMPHLQGALGGIVMAAAFASAHTARRTGDTLMIACSS
jgi:hypothetical protein